LNSAKLIAKITEKWPVKVLSVAAALVIFAFYRTNTLETRSFLVPVIVESDDLFIPVNSFVNSVKINLRGEVGSINTILEGDIEAYVNLERYTNEGTYKAPVKIRKKGGALAVEPLEITVKPVAIELQLEKRTSRNIPVYPTFSGTLAQDYELTGQSITPENVLAEGPRRAMDNLHEFLTETIDLEGRYRDITVLVNIVNDNPLVTVHGNRTVEYSGTVRVIQRELTAYVLEDEDEEDEEETGDSEQ